MTLTRTARLQRDAIILQAPAYYDIDKVPRMEIVASVLWTDGAPSGLCSTTVDLRQPAMSFVMQKDET